MIQPDDKVPVIAWKEKIVKLIPIDRMRVVIKLLLNNEIKKKMREILNSSTICYSIIFFWFWTQRHQLALNFISASFFLFRADCVLSFPHFTISVSIYYYETRPHINHARSEIVIHIIYVLFRVAGPRCRKRLR